MMRSHIVVDQCMIANVWGVVSSNVLNIVPRVINEFCQYRSDENNMVNIALVNEFCELFEDTRTDSMGLQSVIYFPNIDWDDNELIESDDEDDE